MTTLSIVSVILLALLIPLFFALLKKQTGRVAIRCTCVNGQLTLVMTVVVFMFLLAQESVIYNNALTGLYDAQNIDLFYMSKCAGGMSAVAFGVSLICLVCALLKIKRWWLLLGSAVAVIGGTALTLTLFTKHCPTDYYATVVPAVFAEGWCLLALCVNAFADSEKPRQKIAVAAVNILNFICVVAVVVAIAVIANGVTKTIDDTQNVMVALFAVVMVIVAIPSIVNLIFSIGDIIALVKSKKSAKS